MLPEDLATSALAVGLQVLLLYCLSRILFVWVLQAFAVQRHGGGWIVKLLRLPGNLVHETGHAIGYLLCGFRVKRLALCVSDPRGRGVCQAGRPWHPLAVAPLATAAAALFPLLLGTALLVITARLLAMPLPRSTLAGAEGLPLALWDGVRDALFALDPRDWRTYLFIYLGFSIGAELSPSDVDFRRGVLPVLSVCGLVALIAWFAGSHYPHSEAWRSFVHSVDWGMHRLQVLLTLAILTTATVAALLVGPALAWRAIRCLVRRNTRAAVDPGLGTPSAAPTRR